MAEIKFPRQDKTIKLKYLFLCSFLLFFSEIHKASNYLIISRDVFLNYRKYFPYISSIKKLYKKEKKII